MIKNYIKIAFRNILRHKAFTIINILGLSVGIACCLLLSLYIHEELSFDKHFADSKNIYRITGIATNDSGDSFRLASTSPPLAQGIRDNISMVQHVSRLFNPPGIEFNMIKYDEKTIPEKKGYLADSTFFDVFDFPFEEGNPASALKEAQSVVITSVLKTKLFGIEPGLGKVIEIENGRTPLSYKITGVIGKPAGNSHIEFNFLLPMHDGGWGKAIEQYFTSWVGQNMFYTYIKVMPGADLDLVKEEINQLIQKNGLEEMKTMGIHKTQGLQPIADIHLKSSFDFIDLGKNGNILYIYILTSIAAFILMIACINFMNLATAKAKKRSTEVGIRKVLGAERGGLIAQFLCESIVVVIIAILLSVLWIELFLPVFNDITQKNIIIDERSIGFYAASLATIALITGILSGSYPAFFLSSFKPARVLKGTGNFRNGNQSMRKCLVIFQFMISTSLIAGVFIVNQQLGYLRSKDLGFNPSAKIILPLRNDEARGNYDNLKGNLEKLSMVKSITGTDAIPGNRIFDDMMLYPDGGNSESGILTKLNSIDYGFLEMMEMELITGRFFIDNRPVESQNRIVINELAMNKLGFNTDNVIGQIVNFNWREDIRKHEIIGVVKNFHHLSLHESIVPIAYEILDQPFYNAMIIHSDMKDEQIGIAEIRDVWESINTSTPLDYQFLDSHMASLYKEDIATSKIIKFFTALAILISCLGLYGLSLYEAEQRIKEIGVRKVMGASTWEIILLLSKDFSKLSIYAFVLSLPLGYFFMTKWLENFSYKIDLNLLTFFGAGLMAFLIIQLTVSFQSTKAAKANPADSLRNE